MYDRLLREASDKGVDIYEKPMKPTIKGLYCNNNIWINKHLATTSEKACILAEELGHYYTSAGNILDQSKVENRKQELKARSWAYEKLFPLQKIVQAHQSTVRNRYELAEFLGVTEEFLEEAIQRYREKYGPYTTIDNYTICFDPLGVLEMFD
ncbi:Zn-dependent peptidase ImmA (M78 family) [Bacillus thermophilus]|uniref:Zn-dependent peptidase ImmA (M78 family) n=1 Tax=Siminovitchia thermophila TaxID=1245522 RepID=A0ABS2RDH8_9BACI|nr:ImmA/IrrE family metallo-endopeptidase [Siminovitchia thermophila]MBM7717244.1 Zn-dependent peptidase ImmA (M78 family) [Siminovitchia thermophila]ONK22989.1 ImmA/IrrE family metallo-endopeptidase [Bacillus sp. VT-16-64]